MKKQGMPEEKEVTVADNLIEFYRRRFIGIYPSKLHFILALTHKDAYRWNAEGVIECECDYKDQLLDVTDDGWSSLRLSGPTPYSWPAPDKRGAIFNIPENAEKSWMYELSSLIFYINRMSEEAMHAYIDGHYGIQSMGKEYRDNYASESKKNFSNLKAMLKENQVGERIQRIERERYEKTLPPRPPEVKEGVTVRALHHERKAVVQSIVKVLGGEYTSEVCILDTPINGTVYWQKQSLKPVVS
jgi:hypothetical protein